MSHGRQRNDIDRIEVGRDKQRLEQVQPDGDRCVDKATGRLARIRTRSRRVLKIMFCA